MAQYTGPTPLYQYLPSLESVFVFFVVDVNSLCPTGHYSNVNLHILVLRFCRRIRFGHVGIIGDVFYCFNLYQLLYQKSCYTSDQGLIRCPQADRTCRQEISDETQMLNFELHINSVIRYFYDTIIGRNRFTLRYCSNTPNPSDFIKCRFLQNSKF